MDCSLKQLQVKQKLFSNNMCKLLFVILLLVISGGSYADTIPADTFPMQQAELDEIIIVEKKYTRLMQDSNNMLTIDIKGHIMELCIV